MDRLRIALIVSLMTAYVALGCVEIKNNSASTGIAAFLLAIVNGLLFFAGAK